MMEQHLISYYIGIFIVFTSHMYQVIYPMNPYHITMQQHSYINLLAVLLIAYYFLNKEHYISF
jgi:hypothetical protein